MEQLVGEYEEKIIEDLIPPEDFDIEVSNITSSSITVTGSTEDYQSGLKNYTYVVEEVEDGSDGETENTVSKNNKNLNKKEGVEKTNENNKIQRKQSDYVNCTYSNSNYNANIGRDNNITANRRKWNNNKNK